MRKRRKRSWDGLLVVAAFVALPLTLAVVFALLVCPPDTTLTFTGRSEIVTLSTVPAALSRWHLQKAKIFVDESEVARDFTGQVGVQSGARVRFERAGCGPLAIEVEPGVGQRSAGTPAGPVAVLIESIGAEGEEGFFDLRESEALEFLRVVTASASDPACETTAVETFPIEGEAEIGRVIGDTNRAETPILLEGRVSMLARSPVAFGGFEGRFEAGSAELDPGDVFSILAPSDPDDPGSGLVRVDGENGLLVVYHAVGSAGLVERFKASPYRVRPSLWSRLGSDPFFQALLSALAVLVALLSLAASLRIDDDSDDAAEPPPGGSDVGPRTATGPSREPDEPTPSPTASPHAGARSPRDPPPA